MLHVKSMLPLFCILMLSFQPTRCVRSMLEHRDQIMYELDDIDIKTRHLQALFTLIPAQLKELALKRKDFLSELYRCDALMSTHGIQWMNQTLATNSTTNPIEYPTNDPTKQPTKHPTSKPTANPTKYPTNNPTKKPTKQPTKQPTSKPTVNPTNRPTKQPTNQPTSKPTNCPTKKPTKQPTINPTKPSTQKPTKHPTTAKPTKMATTANPTNKWWSNATSSNQRRVRKETHKKEIDDDLLLSRLITHSPPKPNTITIYNLQVFHPEFARSVDLAQLHEPARPAPDLIIKDTPSELETAMNQILEFMMKHKVHRCNETISFPIMFQFLQDLTCSMCSVRPTNELLMSVLSDLKEFEDVDTRCKALLFFFSFDKKNRIKSPVESQETMIIWMDFIGSVVRKLSTAIAEGIRDVLTASTAYIQSGRLPVQFMLDLMSEMEQSIHNKVSAIFNVDGPAAVLKCAQLFLDARTLIDMRSELLALQQVYEWRFVQKRDGSLVHISIHSRNFIPLAIKMGYDEASIQLFDVLDEKTPKRAKQKQRYKLQKVVNHSNSDLSTVSIKEVNQTRTNTSRKTKKKKRRNHNGDMAHLDQLLDG
eukprot:772654_1